MRNLGDDCLPPHNSASHTRSISDFSNAGARFLNSGVAMLHSSATASSATHGAPHVTLYKSYSRETGGAESPFEAHVRGWLYFPQLNRKGKLMIAAVERLVGSPARHEHEPLSAGESDTSYPMLVDMEEPNSPHSGHSKSSLQSQTSSSSAPNARSALSAGDAHNTTVWSQQHALERSSEHRSQTSPPTSRTQSPSGSHANLAQVSSWLNITRPPMFRSRSSKSVLKKTRTAASSPPESPSTHLKGDSVNASPVSSVFNSPTNSGLNSEANSPAVSSANTAPNSPTLSPAMGSGLSISDKLNIGEPPSKRPPMRRTATFTLDSYSSSSGKAHSASHQARKEQKVTIRERMAAISHKSLALRDVQIVLESAPDSRGHRKKRAFWLITDDSGRFAGSFKVPFQPISAHVSSEHAHASIPLVSVPLHGISVISDIDDTVRHSGVTKSKRELLQNVLARSYDDVKVDGVAEWYRLMADAGACFHYVSNSPWQLYDVVHGFLRHHNFPEGSIHLKKYAGVFDGLTEPVKGRKRAALEQVFRDFPNHKFIMVGDSGEADLEAYGEVAQKFPDQVLAIYIRDITLPPDEPLSLYEKRLLRHRRYHSVDNVSLQKEAKVNAADKPPTLPPRTRTLPADVPGVRSSLAVESSAQSALSAGAPHASGDTRQYKRQPAEGSSLNGEANESAEGAYVSADSNAPSVYASPAMSASQLPVTNQVEKSTEFSGHELGVDDRSPPQSGHLSDDSVVKTDSTRSPVGTPELVENGVKSVQLGDEKPQLPPRPKLLRRTSSKILEGMYSVATASSHAAARLLGPQLPPRPGTRVPRSRDVSPGAASRAPRTVHNSSNGDEHLAKPRRSHAGQSFDDYRTSMRRSRVSSHDDLRPNSRRTSVLEQDESEGSSRTSPAAAAAQRRSSPGSSSMYDYGANDSVPGYFSSTQEFDDFDRPYFDKRSETWKHRVDKQYQSLPHHIRLKMWRHPDDVEADSINLIKRETRDAA